MQSEVSELCGKEGGAVSPDMRLAREAEGPGNSKHINLLSASGSTCRRMHYLGKG